MRSHFRYKEGDWFAVPLEDGGYGVGRAARVRRGVVLGYFYGPRRQDLPTADELSDLKPEEAVLVTKVGDLGLIRGIWPIIGRGGAIWHRSAWPIPAFGRTESLTGRHLRVEYEKADFNSVPRISSISAEERSRLPDDGTDGQAALEHRLTCLIQQTEAVDASRRQ